MKSLSKCTTTTTLGFLLLYLQLAPRISHAAPFSSSSRKEAPDHRHQLIQSSPLPSRLEPDSKAWPPDHKNSYQDQGPLGLQRTPSAAQPAIDFSAGVVLGVAFLGVLVIVPVCCWKRRTWSNDGASSVDEPQGITRSEKVAKIRGYPSPSAAGSITGRSTPASTLDFNSLRRPRAEADKLWSKWEEGDLVARNRYSKLFRVAMPGVVLRQVDLALPVHRSGVCAALQVLAAQGAEMHRNVMWPAGYVRQGTSSLVLLYRDYQMAHGTLRDLLRPGCRCEMSAEGGAGSNPTAWKPQEHPTLLRSYEKMLDETLLKCLQKVSTRPYAGYGQGSNSNVTVEEGNTASDEKSDGRLSKGENSASGGMSATGILSRPLGLQPAGEQSEPTDSGKRLWGMVEAYRGKGRPQTGSETEGSMVSSLDLDGSRCTTPSHASWLDSTGARNGIRYGIPVQKSTAPARHLDSESDYSASRGYHSPPDHSISLDFSSDWAGPSNHRTGVEEDLTRRKASLSHQEVCNVLSWERRFGIALGLARGLAYLHDRCSPPIMHIDITSSNVCIDDNFEAMLGDAELSTLLDPAKSIQPDGSLVHVCGSEGYIAPEYETTKLVTCKSNVYSFGVVLLELLTGRQADEDFGQGYNNLVSWMRANASSRTQFYDSVFTLDGRITADTASVRHILSVLRIAMKCLDPEPTRRPYMAAVVEMLERSESRSKLSG